MTGGIDVNGNRYGPLTASVLSSFLLGESIEMAGGVGKLQLFRKSDLGQKPT